MNNSIKTVYGLIVILFVSIIVTSVFFTPDPSIIDFSENRHIFDADDSFIEVVNKEVFIENETALFKVSNNSTRDGWSTNVGWRIEQNMNGQWFTVLEPEPYYVGNMYVFPAGGSFTRSIRLVGLKSGDYRLMEPIRVNETRITAISYFTIN